MADEKPSIGKKELSLRRRGKTAVPPAPVPPQRPESVAELLGPLAAAAEQGEPAGITLPPVSPAFSGPPVSGPPPVPEETARETTPEDQPAGEPSLVAPEAVAPVEAEQPFESPPPEPVAPEPDSEPDLEPDLEPAPELAAAPPRGEQRHPARGRPHAAEKAAKAQVRRERALGASRRRHKRLVGLKIGASQIAAAEVVNRGRPRLVTFARVPLPQGIVVGGEVRDPERLAAELRTLFRKRGLPRKNVRLGIANNRVAVRILEIAGIDDEKQFANAVRFRAQEALPIPLDDAVLDYHVLSERVDDHGVRQWRVLLVVAHKGLVESHIAVCKAAGIKLVGVDLEAFALLRVLTPSDFANRTEDAGLVVVSIGAERSTIAVSDGCSCEYTRVLAWGGSSLDAAVARTLEIEPHDAEPLKRAIGLGSAQVAEVDGDVAVRAREAMRAEVHAFARELVASLRFYQEQPRSLGIAEIFLTGGGAELEGLAEELERVVGVRVSVADPLAEVRLPRKLRKQRTGTAGSLAIAVGLGIEV